MKEFNLFYRSLVLFCALVITSGEAIYAQNLTSPQPIPPAPNAASLGKYGEVPVGKYTGVPDINIPLWQVTEGDIQLPISLSYHASGVKVEENASWVGLGWSLNAGGVITRAVRGKPDEQGYLLSPTYASSGNPPSISNAMPAYLVNSAVVDFANASDCDTKEAVGYMFNVANGAFDSEPDLYYFNFNGMTGKFVLDQNGNAYTIPYQKINIQRVDDNTWTITTIDGNKYTFGTPEQTNSLNLFYGQYGGTTNDNSGTRSTTFNSSWYLTTVQSPTGHQVSFTYDSEYSDVISGTSQTLVWSSISNDLNTPTLSNSGTELQIHGWRLKHINFSNGSVNFVADTPRTDISDFFNPNLLEKIVINDNSGPVKQFVFYTDYFISPAPVQSCLTRRLRLSSLEEWNGDMSVSKPSYFFIYDSTYPLPPKNSTSQDHWGFYNGKINMDRNDVPTLIPAVNQYMFSTVSETTFDINYKFAGNASGGSSVPTNVSVFPGSVFSQGLRNITYTGADRSPDFNYAKAGILTQITYPTGGHTNFTYEPHDYDLEAANYVHATQTYGTSSLSTNDNNVNQGLLTTVVDNGNTCINTQTMTPSQNETASSLNADGTVSMDLRFTFSNGTPNGLGSDDVYCCGFNLPEATLTDLTTGTRLLYIIGRANVPQIYDSSISAQISQGIVTLSGDFTVPDGPVPVWINTPQFVFSGVRLDPTHTYALSTITYHNTPGGCDSHTNCERPTSEVFTVAQAAATYYAKSEEITQYNGTIGGLRIKQIADYSNNSQPVIKNYSYRQSSNPAISSGVIMDWPDYMSNFVYNVSPQDVANVWYGVFLSEYKPSFINYYSHQELVFTSGSKFELGQTGGSFVGYKEVQENYCADNTCATLPVGKKIYRYTSADDYPNVNAGVFGQVEVINNQGTYVGSVNSLCAYDNVPFAFTNLTYGTFLPTDNIYPYPPKTDYDFKRGLLLSEETYDGTGALRKKITNSYNSINDVNNFKVISGLKLANPPGPSLYPTQFAWSFGRYDIITAWNYKSQDVVTDIDLNNNQTITTTNYFYDNPAHGQLTRTEMVNSKGETLQQKLKYPGDESAIANSTSTELAAIAELKTQYRYAAVLEKEENRNGSLMSRTRTGYQDWGNSLVAPASTQLQVGANPMETRLSFQQYDNTNGNLLQYSKTGGTPFAYQWGYNHLYPVAQVSNAKSNDIFYEGFEDGNGNSTLNVAKTGHYSFTGAYSKALAALDNGTYTLTYWLLSGGKWVLTTAPLVTVTSGNYTINLAGQLDDIRFYPSNAQMTTYTYDPLSGMTSSTDPKNEVSYYEYDPLLRLMDVKDKDGNIVKNYVYHYAQVK